MLINSPKYFFSDSNIIASTFRIEYDKRDTHNRYPFVVIRGGKHYTRSVTVAPTKATRSLGAMPICRPRTPALMYMRSWSRQVE